MRNTEWDYIRHHLYRDALVGGSSMLKEMLLKKNMEYVEKVFLLEAPKLAKALGLNKIPTLKWDDANRGTVMCARHSTYVKTIGFFTKIIDHTEPEYTVYVNPEAVSNGIVNYKLMFGKKAEFDYLRTLFAHECRHIWQAQSTFWEGKEYDAFGTDIGEMINGHGSLPEEEDANNFARRYMGNKSSRTLPLVDYLTYEQSVTAFSLPPEVNAKYAEALKAYNPNHAKIVKSLGIIK